jgi:PAS domain S-box-containing protein
LNNPLAIKSKILVIQMNKPSNNSPHMPQHVKSFEPREVYFSEIGALELSDEERKLLELVSRAASNQRHADSGFSHELMAHVVDDATERMAYIYDQASGAFVCVGEAFVHHLGFTADEIMEMPHRWRSLIHPDDADSVLSNSSFLNREVGSKQLRILCKDGRWEWIKNDWLPVSQDDEGNTGRVVGLAQIVTRLALKNQALVNEVALTSLHRTLAEEWVEAIFIVDLGGAILYASQQSQVSTGYSLEELMQKPFDRLFRTTPKPQMARGATKSVQRNWLIRQDRRTYPVEITTRPFAKNKLLISTRDITDQIESERRSSQQTAHYKALFENTPCGVATFDASFELVEVNQRLRSMLGYSESQISHKPIEDIVVPDCLSIVQEWKRQVSDRKADFHGETVEITLRRRDGRPVIAHAVMTAMSDDTAEGVFGMLILMDITAKRNSQLELARQHQFNEKLIREAAALIILLDRHAKIVMVNPAVEIVTQFKSKELVGKTLWLCGLLDKAEIPNAKQRMKDIMNGAERVSGVARARTSSGELRVLQIQNTATRLEDGTVENVIITAIDITEQHRLQQHLMEAVEQEQARIGHDLHDGVGQLLTGIGTLAESLQADLQGRQKEDAERIYQLIRETIHQVRQLSHTMSPASVQNRDLSASLLLLADSVRTNFRRQCETNLAPDIQIRDPQLAGHLFRIAQESVNNAIRHGAPKKINISLRREGAKEAVLEIFNDGATFDCKPGSTTEGIGLRVMKHRAGLIQSSIQVTCPSAGGVLVSCRFPLAPK